MPPDWPDLDTRRSQAAAGIHAAEARVETAAWHCIAAFIGMARAGILGASPHSTALTADAGSGESGPPPPDMAAWPDQTAWEQLLRDALMPTIGGVFGDRFTQVLAGAQIADTPYRQAYLDQVHDRLTIWPKGAWDTVQAETHEGMAAGESITQLRDRLGAALDVSTRDGSPWQWRARLVARTESQSAYNGGSHAAAQAWSSMSGEQLYKQWWAVDDARTRRDHAQAHEQIQPINAPFDVGGWQLAHPGDPDGPASEICNCRCVSLYLSAQEAAAQGYTAASEGDVADDEDNLGDDDAQLTAAGGTMPTPTTEPVPAETSTPAGLPTGWSGVLAPLDVPSGDGRMLAAPADGADPRVRPLPLPLLYQEELEPGHMGAVEVGSIDQVWVDGGKLMGSGRFDLGDTDAQEVVRKMADGFGGWISVDLDDMTVAMQCRQGGKEIDCGDDMLEQLLFGEPGSDPDAQPVTLVDVATDWRLMSATLVSQPAFPEAKVQLVYDDEPAVTAAASGNTDLPFAPRDTSWSASDAATAVAAWASSDGSGDTDTISWSKYGQAFLWKETGASKQSAFKLPFATVIDGKLMAVFAAVSGAAGAVNGARGGVSIPESDLPGVKSKINQLYRSAAQAFHDSSIVPPWDNQGNKKNKAASSQIRRAVESPGGTRVLVASSAPETWTPPADWFSDPGLGEPTPFTVTESGRVYGHLATWGTCHTGYPGSCVTPPRNASGYAYFHTRPLITDTGEETAVGLITMGTGHADIAAGAAAATAHYDDTGTQAAAVRVGEDAHGVWVAGAVLPDVDADQVRRLGLAALSGDWRSIAGRMELVGALAVNVPGFPIPRATSKTSGDARPLSLVAAGVMAHRRRRPLGTLPLLDVDRLAAAVATKMTAIQDARTAQTAAQRAAANQRAATVHDATRRVRAGRVHTLATRIHQGAH